MVKSAYLHFFVYHELENWILEKEGKLQLTSKTFNLFINKNKPITIMIKGINSLWAKKKKISLRSGNSTLHTQDCQKYFFTASQNVLKQPAPVVNLLPEREQIPHNNLEPNPFRRLTAIKFAHLRHLQSCNAFLSTLHWVFCQREELAPRVAVC